MGRGFDHAELEEQLVRHGVGRALVHPGRPAARVRHQLAVPEMRRLVGQQESDLLLRRRARCPPVGAGQGHLDEAGQCPAAGAAARPVQVLEAVQHQRCPRQRQVEPSRVGPEQLRQVAVQAVTQPCRHPRIDDRGQVRRLDRPGAPHVDVRPVTDRVGPRLRPPLHPAPHDRVGALRWLEPERSDRFPTVWVGIAQGLRVQVARVDRHGAGAERKEQLVTLGDGVRVLGELHADPAPRLRAGRQAQNLRIAVPVQLVARRGHAPDPLPIEAGPALEPEGADRSPEMIRGPPGPTTDPTKLHVGRIGPGILRPPDAGPKARGLRSAPDIPRRGDREPDQQEREDRKDNGLSHRSIPLSLSSASPGADVRKIPDSGSRGQSPAHAS